MNPKIQVGVFVQRLFQVEQEWDGGRSQVRHGRRQRRAVVSKKDFK